MSSREYISFATALIMLGTAVVALVRALGEGHLRKAQKILYKRFGYRRSRMDQFRRYQMNEHLIGGAITMVLYAIYIFFMPFLVDFTKPPAELLLVIWILFLVFLFVIVRKANYRNIMQRLKLQWLNPTGLGAYPISSVMISHIVITLMVLSTGVLRSPFVPALLVVLFATQFVFEDLRDFLFGNVTWIVCALVVLAADRFSSSGPAFLGGKPLIASATGVYILIMYFLIIFGGASLFYAVSRHFHEFRNKDFTDFTNAFELATIFTNVAHPKDKDRWNVLQEGYRTQLGLWWYRKRWFRRRTDSVKYDIDRKVANVRLGHAVSNKKVGSASGYDEINLTMMHRLWGLLPQYILAKHDLYREGRKEHARTILRWITQNKSERADTALGKETSSIGKTATKDITTVSYQDIGKLGSLGREAFAINWPPVGNHNTNFKSCKAILISACAIDGSCPRFESAEKGFFMCDSTCNHKGCPIKIFRTISDWKLPIAIIAQEAFVNETAEIIKELASNKNGKFIYFMCCPATLFLAAPLLQKYPLVPMVFHPITPNVEKCDYMKCGYHCPGAGIIDFEDFSMKGSGDSKGSSAPR